MTSTSEHSQQGIGPLLDDLVESAPSLEWMTNAFDTPIEGALDSRQLVKQPACERESRTVKTRAGRRFTQRPRPARGPVDQLPKGWRRLDSAGVGARLHRRSSATAVAGALREPSAAVSQTPRDQGFSEGTVYITVGEQSCARRVLDFVQELCNRPQLRLTRLVGSYQEGVELWLRLREPLCVEEVLLQVEGVASAVRVPSADAEEGEKHFNVELTPDSAPTTTTL